MHCKDNKSMSMYHIYDLQAYYAVLLERTTCLKYFLKELIYFSNGRKYYNYTGHGEYGYVMIL